MMKKSTKIILIGAGAFVVTLILTRKSEAGRGGYGGGPPIPGAEPVPQDRSVPVPAPIITLTTITVHFASGDFSVSETNQVALDGALVWNPTYRLLVSGYADSVGDNEANRLLSLERANAVKNYLVSRGVNTDRIIVYGKGETEPTGENSTAEGRAQNRRVVVEWRLFVPGS